MTSSEFWSGQARNWRYLAQRIDGSGTPGPFLHNELPLQQATYVDVNSGPEQLTGSISPVFREMLSDVDGLPILHPWQTLIWAERDDVIVGGGLLLPSTFTGPQWSLSCIGMPGYAAGMGCTATLGPYVQADPLDIVRALWAHLQSGYLSNLGLIVDSTTHSPVRIGDAPAGAAAAGQVQTTSNVVQYTPWTTADIGGEIDKLAQQTPFEYHVRHQWNASHTAVSSYLDFGYPLMGRRRPERFVLGENIHTVPQALPVGDYANHVRVLGAGEGSAMIMQDAAVADGNLRRMATISDTSITTNEAAQQRARQELGRRRVMYTLREVLVRESPNAEIPTIQPGDEIFIQTDADWLASDLWYRVVSRTLAPASGDFVKLTLDLPSAATV